MLSFYIYPTHISTHTYPTHLSKAANDISDEKGWRIFLLFSTHVSGKDNTIDSLSELVCGVFTEEGMRHDC